MGIRILILKYIIMGTVRKDNIIERLIRQGGAEINTQEAGDGRLDRIDRAADPG